MLQSLIYLLICKKRSNKRKLKTKVWNMWVTCLIKNNKNLMVGSAIYSSRHLGSLKVQKLCLQICRKPSIKKKRKMKNWITWAIFSRKKSMVKRIPEWTVVIRRSCKQFLIKMSRLLISWKINSVIGFKRLKIIFKQAKRTSWRNWILLGSHSHQMSWYLMILNWLLVWRPLR